MTKTLGSRSNASLILAHMREHSYVLRYSRYFPEQSFYHKRLSESYVIEEALVNLPEGWKYLGSGWSRDAFLGPDGVVYKVARNFGLSRARSQALACSYSEAKTYKEKHQLAWEHGFRLAECKLLNNSVIAMEYVSKSGRHQLDWEIMMQLEIILGLADLHSDNCWLDEDGIPTIIDYAE